MSSFFALLALVFMVSFYPAEGGWIKLNDDPVCIGAKDEQFGKIIFNDSCITTEAMFASFKLRHRSGMIRCTAPDSANSKWGCNTSGLECALGIVMTDEANNNVIFPKKRLVEFKGNTCFYEIPGFDGQSDFIKWSDFASPLCILPGQELRLWYAEDLKNSTEVDNFGETCVDVFGYVTLVHH